MIIADLENQIIERLKARSGTGEGKLGYTLDVASYGGEFDTEQDIVAARVRFPAVRVLLKSMGRGQDLGHGQIIPIVFTVFVAAKNLRNERSRRHGAAGEVGSYQIAWDVRSLLKGQTLGLDLAEPIVPGEVASIWNGKIQNSAISLYACSFTAKWFEDLTPEADEAPGEFTHFDGAWDVPPLGNVTGPLPVALADCRTEFNPRSTSP